MELRHEGVLEEERAEILSVWAALSPHEKRLLLDLARAFASREIPVAADAPD